MKKLLVLAMVSAVGFGAWKWHSHAQGAQVPAAGDSRLVLDRLWIDHVPKNDRDTVQVFAALSEEAFGVFQQTSAWKGGYEIFQFEAQGDQLRMVFPQDGTNAKVRATARRCNEAGMDYCLELSGGNRGVKRYYSMEGWEIGSLADEQAKVRALTK